MGVVVDPMTDVRMVSILDLGLESELHTITLSFAFPINSDSGAGAEVVVLGKDDVSGNCVEIRVDDKPIVKYTCDAVEFFNGGQLCSFGIEKDSVLEILNSEKFMVRYIGVLGSSSGKNPNLMRYKSLLVSEIGK